MRLPLLTRRLLSLSIFFFSFALASAHDLSASYATLRFKPDALQLEVKIAAETAWAQVQATLAPGTVLTMEEFETVARPLLLKFAATMEELTVEGKTVAPRETKVVVAEDNFIFTFTYPRPAKKAVLKETYLKRMPSDYVSRAVVLDAKEEPAASKSLHPTDLAFEFTAPPLSLAH